MAKHPALHQSVFDVWHKFSEPLEGARIPYLYADVKGLLTTGTGNLVDPLPLALPLPWKIDGRPATEREIREDWMTLKGEDERRIREGERPLRKMHHRFAAGYTRIRLDDADIIALVESKLHANVAYFAGKIFPDFATFPADAQLALCSIAWAVGPGLDVDAFDNGNGKWPNLSRAVRAQDWAGCVAGVKADNHSGSYAAKIKEDNNAGVVPRNIANVLCFRNAAAVVEAGAPIDVLHWPHAFDARAFAEEAPTSPAVPHPGPAPTPLAGPFSVAEAVVRDALKGR